MAAEAGVHHVAPAALSLTQATEWGTVYRSARSRNWRSSPARTACACTWTAPGSPTPSHGSAARPPPHLARRRRRAVAGRHQERRAGGRSGAGVRPGPGQGLGRTPQARRPPPLQDALPQRPAGRHARAGPLAALRRARQRHGRPAGRWARRCPSCGWCSRSRPTSCSWRCRSPGSTALRGQGFAFHDWLAPPGVALPVVRLVTSFATQPDDVDALIAAAAGIAPQGLG